MIDPNDAAAFLTAGRLAVVGASDDKRTSATPFSTRFATMVSTWWP